MSDLRDTQRVHLICLAVNQMSVFFQETKAVRIFIADSSNSDIFLWMVGVMSLANTMKMSGERCGRPFILSGVGTLEVNT